MNIPENLRKYFENEALKDEMRKDLEKFEREIAKINYTHKMEENLFYAEEAETNMRQINVPKNNLTLEQKALIKEKTIDPEIESYIMYDVLFGSTNPRAYILNKPFSPIKKANKYFSL